jgi:tetratricopeptide (TPR) repeat protein
MTNQGRPPRSGKRAPRPSGSDDGVDASCARRRGGVDIVGSQVHAAGDIVGHDKITQIAINLLPEIRRLPYRLLVAVIVAAIVLLPSLTTAQPMSGLFNIAIADFGEVLGDGRVVPWDKSAPLRETLYKGVAPEFASIGWLQSRIQMRADGVGLVQGKTGEARRESARRLAKNLNASVLIYGNVENDGTTTKFAPEFYVSDFAGAEELLGRNQIGTPVVTSPLIISDALQARTEAVTFMTIGLTYLAVNDPLSASKWFERATQVSGWRDSEGKEVLYLLLGTAYMGAAYRGGDVPSDLVRAREAYATAVKLSPGYSRGYIGLGNVAYEQYRRDGQVDPTILDTAIDEYRRAQAAWVKPEAAQVDAKLHVSLGNVYLVKAQMEQPDAFASAEDEFRQVVHEYEQGNRNLRDLAAQAYFGLGAVEERGTGDYARAVEYYRRCMVTASEGHSVREFAQTQLKAVEEQLETPEAPVRP